MKKNALMIGPKQLGHLDRLDRALLEAGFATVRVSTVRDALYRLDNELFSVIVCHDPVDGSVQRELAAGLLSKPFGCTTPTLVLGPGSESAERSCLSTLLDQYFRDSTETEMIVEFINETHNLRNENTKRGNLAYASVPRILAQASRLRLDGALVFESGEDKCMVYLESGFVVFASSSRDENRFGEFLVQQRIISKDQFFHAAKILQQTKKKRLGRILVEEGFLKPQVLTTLIQSQVKHIVFSVFDWQSGEFIFLPGELSGQNEAIARFEVPPLIMEGVRFKYSDDRLEKEFEPFDARVSLAIPLQECQRRVALNRHELDFLRLVGNGRPLHEMLTVASFSRSEVLKFLYSFKVLGLLAFEAGAAPPPTREQKVRDRQEALRELFSHKRDDSRAMAEMPVPVSHDSSRLLSRTVYMALGALSFAVLSSVVYVSNFLEPRTSEEGYSREQPHVSAPPVVSAEKVVEVASPVAVAPSPAPTETPKVTPALVEAPTSDGFEEVFQLAEAEKSKGKLDVALTNYQRAIRLRPQEVRALLPTANLLYDLDRVAEAESLYRRVLLVEPMNWSANLALGTIYLEKEDPRKAARHYHKYLDAAPRTAENRQRMQEVQKILQSLESR